MDLHSISSPPASATAGSEPIPAKRSFWGHRLAVYALLAVATIAAHGRSLHEGLWLDDHWHQSQIRQMGWSVGALFDATTIEPERLIDTWWQDRPVRWQYARPAAVLLMKIVHHLSGGAPAAHHGVSLFLHFASACMVFHLCLLLTRRRFWSAVGGLIFVVYAHSVFAVAWLAAQNSVLQTTLMLAAVLCYIHASGLELGPASAGTPNERTPPPLRRLTLVAALLLWVVALFSRESAIVFPAMAMAFDGAFGGRRHWWQRRRLYIFLGAVSLAYLIWRLTWHFHPMPSPYVRSASEPGYLLFCAIKLLHYVCSSIWQSPMTIGPTGRYDPLLEAPGDCLLMLAIVAVLGTGYYFACRRIRGYWIWPLWLVLCIIPVVPILATPQSGYPCGVAFAVAVVLGPALSRASNRKHTGRLSRPIALAFLIATCTYVPIYRITWEGMLAAERYTIAEITMDAPPNGVSDLFFLNLPFVNVYVQTHLAEVWGEAMSGVRCHVLTYAPELLRMGSSCSVTQHDAHTLSIAVEGQPYFSRLLGRYLIEALRESGPLQAGDTARADLFDVRVERAGQEGVQELRFTFREPLASERFRFYLCTPCGGGVRLAFAGPQGVREEIAPLEQSRVIYDDAFDRSRCAQADHAVLRRARDRLFYVRATAADIIRTDLYLTGRPFPGPRARAEVSE